MEHNLFFELSLILTATLVVTSLMKLIKQPSIIGYILSGVILGPSVLGYISDFGNIEALAQVGITILLFMVGINLNPKVIKDVGKVSLITGLGQIVFTTFFGFLIARLFSFDVVPSLIIAIALTFSSTIIIMKLISDKGDMDKLYGKISIGFLIVQDLVAALILMVFPSLANDTNNLFAVILLSLAKALIIISIIFVISHFIIEKLTTLAAKSQELLLLFTLSWCMAIATAFSLLGFSMEIGALLAGITLSMSSYKYEISSRVKPIRDFFIILFFILLGAQMSFVNISNIILPIIVMSAFVLIGNPLIVMFLMGWLGYTKKNGFLAGLTVAQISEFSLILASLGVSLNYLNNEQLSLITMVGIITIALSSYMIIYSDELYSKLNKFLSIFEFGKKAETNKSKLDLNTDVILFGYNRIGFDLLNSLKKINKSFLIIDYNPDTIKDLESKNIPCIYGDAEDVDLLNDEIKFNEVKMIISTIPDYKTNSMLIKHIRTLSSSTLIFVVSHKVEESIQLYDLGADYVIMPHFLGGVHTGQLIETLQFSAEDYHKYKTEHINYLDLRKMAGHEHPTLEKGEFYQRVF